MRFRVERQVTAENRMVLIGIFFFFRAGSEFPLPYCAIVNEAYAAFFASIAVFKHLMKGKCYFAITTLPFLAMVGRYDCDGLYLQGIHREVILLGCIARRVREKCCDGGTSTFEPVFLADISHKSGTLGEIRLSYSGCHVSGFAW